MKKYLIILFTMFLCMIKTDLHANDITVANEDGVNIYYNFINDGTELEVVGCSSTTNLIIPNEVIDSNKKYKVTGIGNRAFHKLYNLISITIPNGVNKIGDEAFSGCYNLESIYCLPEVAPSTGNYTFSNSNPTVYVTETALPSYLSSYIWKKIGARTTYKNTIDIDGIYYCLGVYSNVAEVAQAPNGYGDRVKIEIPETVTYNEQLYYVKYIGNSAFYECNNLVKVTIPNNIISIGDYAFYKCYSLPQINIPKSVTSIGDFSFQDCTCLTSVTIPDNVTNIGIWAFHGCTDLRSVIIGNSVAKIGYWAFAGCTSLESISIPNSLTILEGGTFSDCRSLTSISIGKGIKAIEDDVFKNCKNIVSVYIYDLEAWCNIEFSNQNSSPMYYPGGHLFLNGEEIVNLIIPDNITKIKKYSFYCCYGLKSVTMPNSVLTVDDNAFQNCSNISELNIANSVTEIGNMAFFNCSSLTSLIIPNSTTSIGEEAFGSCYKLQTVKLPENLNIIKRSLFRDCSHLKNIIIPSTVEYIYQTAFFGCPLEYIKVLSNTPPFLYDNSFSDYSIPLRVPKGCKEVYQSAEVWKNFTNISDADKYKLTYVVDGEEYKSSEIEEGEAITPETEPTKEGYTFSGWSDLPETMPAKDVTVTGTFTVNKYKLTYSVDGEDYKSYDIEYGSTITSETEPTKEGYTFSGWSDLPETMPAKDVTVTGTFTVNKYKLTYSVDGEEYKSYDIEYGSTITSETEPTKEGYTFSGWSDLPETMPAKDVTVTGTFTVNKYKLSFSVDGEEYKSYDVEYGSTITSETEPTKEGYTFSGWSDLPETMPANDVTVTGSFTVNKYKLTYSVDGEEYKSYDIEYGSTITSETEPTKEGYTFSGWSEIPETMPAHDVTVTGTFTINKYKVTYMIDGEVYQTVEVEYGSTITPPNPGDREGYDFAWGDYPSTMPAKDITINGSYTATDIRAVLADESDVKIYNVSGKPSNNLQKGVNILRYKDGRTQKLIIK